uniref:Aquaporin n=1 Tax=Chlamydomonas leiostraca TaxID=1034604 RepID=A0A7S0RKK3_9CHLO|mmetsp:Transcript_2546/g.6532  ORF Transcript_2546/g.6532 Transcript_2546/m.6532 type:complete len:306 (+) Transcript_2546:96-1013(+)|eukprot:CAMPEP_0202867728 /NCGR_PEP_ID=MMETSP1391-20130828/9591_1 /ASSEMBLY_ACC=CAM_ASM_000867 /TAXON_ID=1034604 /ORGANISM="Chlamydomonas leiostraca, Strain SAG 11-49" /LENGTH=305 /DNA_ID=CAMNT_0049547791 /DNA_START=96 /DNA_END=1013 /DNA_ORIENTATION=+
MSSSLEVQGSKGPSAYDRYGEEAEGLVESGQTSAQVAAAKPAYQDDEGILPVILEDYLERAGIMDKLRPYINTTGQIRNETARQLLAEFFGTMLFQMFGGSAPAKDTTAPAANGFALVALIYAFANVSGGHLNPAVSFALICTGHMKWWKGLLYMIAQIIGSIFGALIYTSLIPALHIGSGAGSPGCFAPANNTSKGGVFGWEMMMTFLLVMTVYAAAVAKPGHGNTAPLAIGLSLYAAAISGGPYTGASLNPARTIGPAVVFTCNVGISFLYIFAEFFGAACAAGLSIFLYGRNPSVRVRGQGL